MGFFSAIKRNYRNAGANLHVFLYCVESLDCADQPDEPNAAFRCTGLELHNFAQQAKKDYLAFLEEHPDQTKTISVPRDFWRLGMNTVTKLVGQQGLSGAHADLARNCLCLVIEAAFQEYSDRDIISVFLARDTAVAVERVPHDSPFDLSRKNLGRIDGKA
jgi:hypothetical protein